MDNLRPSIGICILNKLAAAAPQVIDPVDAQLDELQRKAKMQQKFLKVKKDINKVKQLSFDVENDEKALTDAREAMDKQTAENEAKMAEEQMQAEAEMQPAPEQPQAANRMVQAAQTAAMAKQANCWPYYFGLPNLNQLHIFEQKTRTH